MDIPDDKRFFRIGEVSRIVGVKPYVIRYWESEFPSLRPRRADSRQRTYQTKDIEILGEIKRLLYEERLTIEGAKKRIKMAKTDIALPSHDFIIDIKEELEAILKILK